VKPTLAQRVRQLAAERPDDTSYVCEEQTLSWRGYDQASTRLAVSLADGLALGRGERVAVLLPDGPGIHCAFLGCEKAGVIAVGIGPRAGRQEIEHLIRVTQSSTLISAREHQELATADIVRGLAEQGTSLRHHLVVEGELGLGGQLTFEGAPAPEGNPAVLDGRGMAVDELFLLNSTSGTTGMPKCVTHDQARWLAFHDLALRHGDLFAGDVFMSVVPAPFGFGIWTSHVTPTLLGVPTVVMPRFDASLAMALVEKHRVTVLAAVSTQFIMMLNALESRARDLSSLRVLFTGGERVPYERAAEFEERTGARVLQFYGSNETGAVSGTSLRDTREKRLRTAGKVIPEMNVRLFDEDGHDVTHKGRGQPGCKGPTLSRGYYGDGPDSVLGNAQLIRDDGWMLLGDLVSLDQEGYLEVIGRSDDFIVRGGKNISGPGVEEQVASHPSIALAAAVAMPDAVFGERVCVYVELRPGADTPTLDDVIEHLRVRNASKESWPERLEIVDALPRGSGGKVAKQALRDDIRRRLASESR